MESQPTERPEPTHKLFLRSAQVVDEINICPSEWVEKPYTDAVSGPRGADQTPSGQVRLSFPLTATVCASSWSKTRSSLATFLRLGSRIPNLFLRNSLDFMGFHRLERLFFLCIHDGCIFETYTLRML
ncbi:hypothetical protein Zmor_010497 [Zophobas morio]|uniref:Uncharacterized protein n=1 Tax=Zophobas morio TaxID=2755281 RepID=A0AA38MJR2_9CUCU|nr:hypothetical protein Zmor_010497 [Zophobas morio]